jgi:outer membrane protein TolC
MKNNNIKAKMKKAIFTAVFMMITSAILASPAEKLIIPAPYDFMPIPVTQSASISTPETVPTAADTPVPITPAAAAAMPVTPMAIPAAPVPLTPTAVTAPPTPIILPAAAEVTATPTAITMTAVELDEAIIRAINNSAGILQALYDWNSARAGVEKEKGKFDVNANGSVKYSESSNASLAIQDPDQEKLLVYRAGLSNRLATGGDLSLDLTSSRTLLLFPAYSYGIDAALFRPSINPYYQPGLALTYRQPLLRGFLGDPSGRKIKIAENRERAARENLKDAIIGQVLNLKRAYYAVYLSDICLKAKTRHAFEADALYRGLKASGSGEAGLLQAKAAMLSAKAEIPVLGIKLKNAGQSYLNTAGYRPEEWDSQEVKTTETAEDAYVPREMTGELMDTLIEVQPRVTCEKFAQDAAEMDYSIAWSSALPSLNITGSYAVSGISGDFGEAFQDTGSGRFKDFSVGADLLWSLPNREGSGEAAEKQEALKKARVSYENTKNELRIKISAAYSAISAAKNNYTALKEARLLLERRAVLAQQSAASGAAPARDAVNAQQDRYNARISEAEAFVAWAEAIAGWNALTGKYDGYFNDYIKNIEERQK